VLLRTEKRCHAFRHGFFVLAGRKENIRMENRIAAVSVIVEEPESVEALNGILHDYSACVIGRMGIPYREKGVNVICLVLDAPTDTVNALTGKLGRLPGVTARAVCSQK
jgi:putative iron-only hydrogenase system regulator